MEGVTTEEAICQRIPEGRSEGQVEAQGHVEKKGEE